MSKEILLIHGMWGGGWYWDKFQGYFENKGYHCISPYLRHHDIQPDAPPPPGLGKTKLSDCRACCSTKDSNRTGKQLRRPVAHPHQRLASGVGE